MRIATLLLGCACVCGAAVAAPQPTGAPAKKTAAVPKKSAPAAKKSAPVAKKNVPVAKKSASATKKSAPVARKGAPAAKKGGARGTGRTAAARRPAPPRYQAQRTPSPERYKEIQAALASRGYFQGSPDGVWNQQSIDALKRFQREQNLEVDGKINSLSLIALGLGPRYEAAAASPAKP